MPPSAPPAPSANGPRLEPNSSPSTATGLLLLMVCFALGWVPVVALAGGICGIIGLVYMYLGRRDLGPRHHRSVVLGLVLEGAAIFGAVGVAVLTAFVEFVSANRLLFGQGGSTASLTGYIVAAIVISAAVAVIGGIGRIWMVRAIASATQRRVLWIAFGVNLAGAIGATAALFALILPSANPFAAYASWQYLLDAFAAIPSLLFAWAYYGVRGPLIGRRPTDFPVGRAPRYDF